MSKLIDVQQAEINTVAIEIKTLTIGRKQMTLSVFRQLPKSDIIASYPEYTRRGEIWGQVNYFWGECEKLGTHLHIVWQEGTQLKRSCVFPPPSFLSFVHGDPNKLLSYVNFHQLIAYACLEDRVGKDEIVSSEAYNHASLDQFKIHLPEGSIRFWYTQAGKFLQHKNSDYYGESVKAALEQECQKYPDLGTSYKTALECVRAVLEERRQTLSRWKATYKECTESPQPFIAV